MSDREESDGRLRPNPTEGVEVEEENPVTTTTTMTTTTMATTMTTTTTVAGASSTRSASSRSASSSQRASSSSAMGNLADDQDEQDDEQVDDNVDVQDDVVLDENDGDQHGGEGDGEGEEEEEEEELQIHWNMRRTAEEPCSCCGKLCGLWIASILLLVILSATVSGIAFTIDLPFYDRTEINQRREDSYQATGRDADFVANYGQDSGELCVNEDPTTLTRTGDLEAGPEPTGSCQRATSNQLRLIYIAKDAESNVFTPENLRQIQKIEERILETLHLSRYCYLQNSTFPAFTNRNVTEWSQTFVQTAQDDPTYYACERIFSPLNFLDPLYFDIENESGLGYYILGADLVPQEYNFTQAHLDRVIAFWNNFTQREYDITRTFPAAAATVGGTISVVNLFQFVTSTDFVMGSTEIVGLTSAYSLGLPVSGYFSSSIDVSDQYKDMGQWLWEELDEYLKGASFGNVAVYWADSRGGMSSAEAGALAQQSFLLFPASVLSVLCYLIIMQDSFFIGLMGLMQIILAFFPCLLIYTYVIQEDYIGILNMISFYIILGIGVDDIFVFCDQFHHNKNEKMFTKRMQKTFNVAAKAMFTTSCTTFISFMANATSAFPAVSTFGIFSATLVLVNYCAMITFFPAVYSVYWTYVRQKWWDHPFLLFRCKKEVPDEDDHDDDNNRDRRAAQDESKEYGQVDQLEEVFAEEDEKAAKAGEGHGEGHGGGGSFLVKFFRDRWAPFMIRFRYPIVAVFGGVLVVALVFTVQLQPDENAPTIFPNGNNYRDQPGVLLRHFARSGNPRAIDVRWVSGINRDDPIDRAGTDDTNVTDYGVAKYVDCASFDPTTPAAQVWALQTCHDMFFGNVTEYHGGTNGAFDVDGDYGPVARKIVSTNIPRTETNYYRQVSCLMQGFRDWTLTDSGCLALSANGLPCLNETSAREGCVPWDVDGNSCEPFPIPSDLWRTMLLAFFQDPTPDANSQETNYDAFSEHVFAMAAEDIDPDAVAGGDFECRTVASSPDGSADVEGSVLFAYTTIATLDQDFSQNFEDGIALYDKWDAWSDQMLKVAPSEMAGTMQTSNGAWSFYFLNEILLDETFQGIGLALGLGFVVLTIIGGNIIMAALSMFNICLIVANVFAFTVIAGWSLGVIEAVNYVVVIGMSIDYSVHMSEAYTDARASTRAERVILMVEEMGVSVLSGALSTMLAAFWMFFAPNSFFLKFASFLFTTILLSCIYALVFFPAILSIVGPLGNTGGVYAWFRRTEMYATMMSKYNEIKERHFGQKSAAEWDDDDNGDGGGGAKKDQGDVVKNEEKVDDDGDDDVPPKKEEGAKKETPKDDDE